MGLTRLFPFVNVSVSSHNFFFLSTVSKQNWDEESSDDDAGSFNEGQIVDVDDDVNSDSNDATAEANAKKGKGRGKGSGSKGSNKRRKVAGRQ